jgi:transposase
VLTSTTFLDKQPCLVHTFGHRNWVGKGSLITLLRTAGNRQINRVLHIMARVQIRNPSEGRDYYERKKAGGKAPMEAMRCVKRRLSDIVYQRMLHDALTRQGTSPGGQQGNDSDSSAAGSHPNAGSSDKPLPGPATSQPKTPLRRAG